MEIAPRYMLPSLWTLLTLWCGWNVGYVVDEAEGANWADGADRADGIDETDVAEMTLRMNALFYFDCYSI